MKSCRVYLIFSIIYTISLWSATLKPFTLFDNYTHPQIDSIKILDAKELIPSKKENSLHELSGMVYKNNILYAINDQGRLFRLSLNIQHDTIASLQLNDSFSLRDTKGKLLKHPQQDAEGLAWYNNHLLISFERNPRIVEYSLGGIALHSIKLPKKLRKKRNYQGSNKMLEALAYLPEYGFITAPEKPLKKSKKSLHTLYAEDKIWHFKAQGDITGLEVIDQTKLLILLRHYSFFGKRFTSLVTLYLDRCDKKRVCQTQLLAQLNEKDGWHIDNFEGICKVAPNKYLMVSDDNNSFFQKTLFVLFEIMN